MEYPNIRSLREDHDFRQCDLASVLHVSQNTYSQYENGVIELTAERLIKLADFYNVSIDYLLGRTDNPEVNRNRVGGPRNQRADLSHHRAYRPVHGGSTA